MEYKTMSDTELASVMVNYISRTRNLMDIITKYIKHPDDKTISPENIKNEYSKLKAELRTAANYVDLVRNHKGGQLYMRSFSPSIREASAFGFTVPVNAAVNHKMYYAVEEANYKLRKYKPLEEWEELL